MDVDGSAPKSAQDGFIDDGNRDASADVDMEGGDGAPQAARLGAATAQGAAALPHAQGLGGTGPTTEHTYSGNLPDSGASVGLASGEAGAPASSRGVAGDTSSAAMRAHGSGSGAVAGGQATADSVAGPGDFVAAGQGLAGEVAVAAIDVDGAEAAYAGAADAAMGQDGAGASERVNPDAPLASVAGRCGVLAVDDALLPPPHAPVAHVHRAPLDVSLPFGWPRSWNEKRRAGRVERALADTSARCCCVCRGRMAFSGPPSAVAPSQYPVTCEASPGCGIVAHAACVGALGGLPPRAALRAAPLTVSLRVCVCLCAWCLASLAGARRCRSDGCGGDAGGRAPRQVVVRAVRG